MKEDLSPYMIPNSAGRYETQRIPHDAARKEVDHNRHYLKVAKAGSDSLQVKELQTLLTTFTIDQHIKAA